MCDGDGQPIRVKKLLHSVEYERGVSVGEYLIRDARLFEGASDEVLVTQRCTNTSRLSCQRRSPQHQTPIDQCNRDKETRRLCDVTYIKLAFNVTMLCFHPISKSTCWSMVLRAAPS